MQLRLITLLVFAVFPLLSLTSHAEEEVEINENPLSVVETKVVPYTTGAGATAELQIKITIADHYKAYVDMIKLKPGDENDGLKIAAPRVSPTIKFDDPFSKKVREAAKGEADIKATVEIPANFKAGEQDLAIAFTYQACSTSHCLFPKTVPLKAHINIVDNHVVGQVAATTAAAAPPSDSGTPASGDNDSAFERARKGGTFKMFLFVFLAGVLTSLTPCIYPLIPITLAVIGAKSKGQSRGRSFVLSVAYVLGIAITYAILGVGAASTGALFGAALSNVYIVTGIGLLFVAMGLSMYGLYEVQAPAFVREKLGSAKTGAGVPGAFVSGLISGIVASPCIGPVLVTVLTFIAQTGNRALGFGLLFTFAMGIGMLLITVGTFSQMMNKLPKSGSWMEVVKFIFGTTMIGMALYYVRPLYPQWLTLLLTGAALVLIASFYGAFEANEGLNMKGRLRKGLMAMLLVAGLVYTAGAVIQKLGIATSLTPAREPANHVNFETYSEDAVAKAAAEGKPVIIDFFADWCGACKELEAYTFPAPEVVPVLRDKFVRLRVDATSDTPTLQALKTKFKVLGLPTLIIYDKTGKLREDLTVTGFEEAALFRQRLDKAL